MAFDFDEFTLMAGTPDLLIWTPHPEEPHWFFAEVKAPGDHLQPSQVAWLRANWTALEGHFALIQLCPDTSPLTPRCSGQHPGVRPGTAAELIRR
jgi:hypothetical protein